MRPRHRVLIAEDDPENASALTHTIRSLDKAE